MDSDDLDLAGLCFIVFTTMTGVGGGVFIYGAILMASGWREMMDSPVLAAMMLLSWAGMLYLVVWMGALAVLTGIVVLEEPVTRVWFQIRRGWTQMMVWISRSIKHRAYGLV